LEAILGRLGLTQFHFVFTRLNCPEAAMRSLQLARQHAASDHERLVYEGWILYDTGHCEEGLQKAEASIAIQRSFEAFFLKAYALADSSLDPSTSATVVSLLEDALRCPSDRLRKGQVWFFFPLTSFSQFCLSKQDIWKEVYVLFLLLYVANAEILYVLCQIRNIIATHIIC
jgi:hypothetical protein